MKILVSLFVIGLLLFGVDALARNVAESRAASYVQGEMDLSEKPEVSLGGTPFLLQALDGSIPNVEVDAEALVAKGLELHDVAIMFDSVDVSLGSLVSGDAERITTSGGKGTAALSPASLSRYLERRGVPVEIVIARGAIGVTTPQLGTQNGKLSIDDGRLTITSPALRRPLKVRLPGIAGGLVYDDVTIDRSGIVLGVSVPPGPLTAPAA